MPNVFTDINDFMPYARSMAKRIIREGKHDGVQQFTNDLVALSNDIYALAQEMPTAWERYRKITSERERQSREIAEKQRYIEELNQHLIEQFGMPDMNAGDEDADILSMLSDDNVLDFGDDDGTQPRQDQTQETTTASTQDAASQNATAPSTDDGHDDDDDGLFAVFGGDYGNDGNGRDVAERDSWGNADERVSLSNDDGTAYDDAGDAYDARHGTDTDAYSDDDLPDIDWSAAGHGDESPQPDQRQSTARQPQQQDSRQTSQSQERQQPGGASDDPFDDDDIDVLLDDDALLGL